MGGSTHARKKQPSKALARGESLDAADNCSVPEVLAEANVSRRVAARVAHKARSSQVAQGAQGLEREERCEHAVRHRSCAAARARDESTPQGHGAHRSEMLASSSDLMLQRLAGKRKGLKLRSAAAGVELLLRARRAGGCYAFPRRAASTGVEYRTMARALSSASRAAFGACCTVRVRRYSTEVACSQ